MRRGTAWSFAALAVGAVLVLVAASCGGPNQLARAERGLAASFQAVNAARDGFSTWSKAEQDRIVEGATSLEDGKVKLAEHRKRREAVFRAFGAAYISIGLASSALLLYDAGRVGEAIVIQRLLEAAKAVEVALRAWEAVQ